MCLDLDRVEAINDSFGHHVGEAVLSAVGQTMQRECPDTAHDTALAGRLGSEELALFLFDAEISSAIDFAEHMRKTIKGRTLPDSPDIIFTVGFGVAKWRPDMTAKTWMAAADPVRYHAKEDGRNCLVREGMTEYDDPRNSAQGGHAFADR